MSNNITKTIMESLDEFIPKFRKTIYEVDDLTHGEVVGNIYESPELLK